MKHTISYAVLLLVDAKQSLGQVRISVPGHDSTTWEGQRLRYHAHEFFP
jgi:hypothetical protein